jgi:hypothetical protein
MSIPTPHKLNAADRRWIDDAIGYDNVASVGAAYRRLVELRGVVERGYPLVIEGDPELTIITPEEFDRWVRQRYPVFADDRLHPLFNVQNPPDPEAERRRLGDPLLELIDIVLRDLKNLGYSERFPVASGNLLQQLAWCREFVTSGDRATPRPIEFSMSEVVRNELDMYRDQPGLAASISTIEQRIMSRIQSPSISSQETQAFGSLKPSTADQESRNEAASRGLMRRLLSWITKRSPFVR